MNTALDTQPQWRHNTAHRSPENTATVNTLNSSHKEPRQGIVHTKTFDLRKLGIRGKPIITEDTLLFLWYHPWPWLHPRKTQINHNVWNVFNYIEPGAYDSISTSAAASLSNGRSISAIAKQPKPYVWTSLGDRLFVSAIHLLWWPSDEAAAESARLGTLRRRMANQRLWSAISGKLMSPRAGHLDLTQTQTTI